MDEALIREARKAIFFWPVVLLAAVLVFQVLFLMVDSPYKLWLFLLSTLSLIVISIGAYFWPILVPTLVWTWCGLIYCLIYQLEPLSDPGYIYHVLSYLTLTPLPIVWIIFSAETWYKAWQDPLKPSTELWNDQGNDLAVARHVRNKFRRENEVSRLNLAEAKRKNEIARGRERTADEIIKDIVDARRKEA